MSIRQETQTPLHVTRPGHQQLPPDPPIEDWGDLVFWDTGEWQVVDETLQEMEKKGVSYCPGRANLFRSLDLIRPSDVKVVLIGQDPYPNPLYATGVAFSIPPNINSYPPTLAMIIKELQMDIPGFTFKNGDLTPWSKQGVLLWNAIPSCEAGKSKSHHWPEWEFLTAEIFHELSLRGCLFVFFGSTAKEYEKYVVSTPWTDNRVLWTSHPSPRGNMNSQKPFLGSRIFSSINATLTEMGKEPVDWRL